MVGVYPDRPKLKDLVCELKEVDWNKLGIQLNVPRHILRNIDRENPGNEPRKLSEVLQYWIDNAEPGEALWETIIMALQKIGGHKHIITSIQSKYTINPQPQGRIDHESDKIADYPRVVSRSRRLKEAMYQKSECLPDIFTTLRGSCPSSLLRFLILPASTLT